MKLPLLALCLSLLVAALRAESYTFKEPFSRTAAFAADGTLTLENVNGDITIRTWDKNEILIQGEKSAKTDEELKQIDLNIDLAAARAAVKVRLPKRSGAFWGNSIRAAVRFEITVPATATLEKISTVNSAITVSDLRGPVYLETVNGPLRASGLAGSAHLETVNGSIRADFATLAPAQQLKFETVNGSITVKLPADTGAEIDTDVVNGRIECDFPLALSGGKHRHSLRGTIGDGRARVRAESVNGSIHLLNR